jgi:hypothetical protein
MSPGQVRDFDGLPFLSSAQGTQVGPVLATGQIDFRAVTRREARLILNCSDGCS